MKRYYVGLLVLTIVMIVLAFVPKWMDLPFFAPLGLAALPLAVIYFAVVDGVQYWFTVRSLNKNPKTFVQFFLATTVAVLFLHLVVLVGGMLLNPAAGKRFAIGFLVLYVVYTVYIMAALVHFVKNAGKEQE